MTDDHSAQSQDLKKVPYLGQAQVRFAQRINGKGPIGSLGGMTKSDPTNGHINIEREVWWSDIAKEEKKSGHRKAIDGTSFKLPRINKSAVGAPDKNNRSTLEPPVGYLVMDQRAEGAASVNSVLNHATIPPLGCDLDIEDLENSDMISEQERIEAKWSHDLLAQYMAHISGKFDERVPANTTKQPDKNDQSASQSHYELRSNRANKQA